MQQMSACDLDCSHMRIAFCALFLLFLFSCFSQDLLTISPALLKQLAASNEVVSCSHTDTLTHLLTHSLTHSHAHSLTHSLTHSRAYTRAYTQTHARTHAHPSTHPFPLFFFLDAACSLTSFPLLRQPPPLLLCFPAAVHRLSSA